ncbi:uncharacterized protein LOC126669481 [Mercurialis annua]|uniref:uncharacterized protein LOC126669481 n=1 Tax=Mercurialis annua TaxID=3986 RepID=UPI0021602A77|nr:uncharacterized protein LOC126669481 [Mercurialis annua]
MAKKQGKKPATQLAKSTQKMISNEESNETTQKFEEKPEVSKVVNEEVSEVVTVDVNIAIEKEVSPKKTDEAVNTREEKKMERRWADLVSSNRHKDPACSLKYIPLMISNGVRIAKVMEEDMVDEVERWSHAVLGCVYGLTPRFYKLQSFIKNRWGKLGLIDFHQIKPNLFAFIFDSEEGKMKAIADGPITFDKHPLILQEWKRKMSFDMQEVASVPVWVKFAMLPWEYWNPESLSSITSTLGKPLFADKCTRDRSKLAYARVLIDMKLKGLFPDYVIIEDEEGDQLMQSVEYEWKPILCRTCKRLGHRNCEKQKVWIAKSDSVAVNVD